MPGGGGTGIPVPGRSGKNSKNDTSKAGQPLPNFRGALKQMDDKSLSVELGDNRVLDFKRTGATKFFKAGDEVKQPNFAVGDQLSVEAQEEPGGYLTAVNVYWEKSGGGKPAKSADDTTLDTWKDTPGMSTSRTPGDSDPDRPRLKRADSPGQTERAPERAEAAPAPERAGAAPPPKSEAPVQRAEAAPPVKPDPEDPGPPRLQRGRAADPSRQVSAPVPQQQEGQVRIATDNEEHVSIIRGDREDDAIRPRPLPKDDPLIRRAADTALEFTETLPSYVCTEMIARYQSETRPANFRPIDVVSTDVVYENGREDYRNLQINGKPTKKKIEETGGAWSTGEFGTVLIDLFSPATAADFHFRRDSRAGGVMAKMYDFEVEREHSHWNIHTGSQSYTPAYSGSVWIDPQSSRVLRIEMQAKGMPQDFPTDHVEAATDYNNVRLGDLKQYLLPVHSENLMCQRGTDICSRNVIDFRNYHKYTGESTITFGGTAKDK
jgi:hypothetical protein